MHPSRLACSSFASLLFVLALTPLPAQTPVAPQTPTAPRAVQAPPSLLAPLQVAAGTVQDLAVPNAPFLDFTVDVVLGGQPVTLLLAPHDLRRTGYQLLVDNGTAITPQPAGTLVTFQGSVAGSPQSDVAMVVQHGQLKGIVRDHGVLWAIQPASELDPRAVPTLHVVYRSSDNWNVPHVCGVPNGPIAPTPPASGIDVLAGTDLALEVDFPQFQRFGNATTAQNDALAVVNGMDVIYRRDVGITFTVGTVLVRTTTDPYSSTDAGTLLGQFQAWWNTNQGAVARDVAMLFTGRVINGNTIGIAYVGQICNLAGAYGLTETMYAGTGTNITNRIGLISHEMGHLWNAQHCDAAVDCRIMCSGLGGCTGNVTSFSAGEQAQITSFRDTRTCLVQQPSTPTITSVTPNTTATFAPPQLTINGTGLIGVNQITIGAQVITTGISVVNDTQLRVTPPDATAIGLQLLRVTNSAGTSNPLLFNYVETNPMELTVPTAVLGGTQLQWHFGGHANHYWYTGVALFPATAPNGGFAVLTGFSGLQIGTLNAAGIGSYSIFVPPAILNGLTVQCQALEFDPVTLQISGASNVIATHIFL